MPLLGRPFLWNTLPSVLAICLVQSLYARGIRKHMWLSDMPPMALLSPDMAPIPLFREVGMALAQWDLWLATGSHLEAAAATGGMGNP